MTNPYREFVDGALSSVESVCSGFENPEDDFVPVMLIETLGDAQNVCAVFDPAILNHKDAWTEAMTKMVKETKAVKVALITSTWIVRGGFDSPEEASAWMEEHGSLREHPNRSETVMVHAFDPERAEFWQAEIHRTDDAPPALGEWENIGDQMDVETRFAPIQAAMR